MAMSPFQTFANREVANLIFCDYATGKQELFMSWANTTSAELTGEAVHARGGWGAPRRVSFGGNREGTLTIETQMNCAKLYSIVLGGDLSNKCEYLKRVVVKAADGSLTLPEQKGTISESGLTVFAATDDCGTAIAGATLSENTVTATGLVDGNDYVVYFMVAHDGDVQKLSVGGRVKMKAFKIYGETLVKDEDDIEHSARMVVYKATPQPTASFSFANQGDPGSMTITFDLAADKDNNVLDMIFLDDAE